MQVDYYVLCLDTDKYAGNFERQTVAYATGQVGECGVGVEQSELFEAEVRAHEQIEELQEKVFSMSDDDSRCNRPASIQATPGWVNDGLGSQYRQSNDTPPTPEQIEKYRASHRASMIHYLESARKSTETGYGGWTKEGLEREEKRFKAIDDEIPKWWPAYSTVGIFLREPLSEPTLKLVVSRAKEYLKTQSVTLEGVRLVTRYIDSKSEPLQVEL